MARRHTGALVAALALGVAVPGAAQAAGFDDTFGINGTVFNIAVDGQRSLSGRHPRAGRRNLQRRLHDGRRDRPRVRRSRTSTPPGGSTVTSASTASGDRQRRHRPVRRAARPATTPNGAAEIARGVVVQDDGKIVVAGQAETPPAAGKPDSRDIDIYVARFDTEGVLDPTFGTGGIERIDLCRRPRPGQRHQRRPGLRPLDQAGRQARSSSAPRASTSPTRARTDRDIAVIQLETDGDPDPTFGTAGVAMTRNAGVSENPRHGLLQADGKIIATGYGNRHRRRGRARSSTASTPTARPTRASARAASPPTRSAAPRPASPRSTTSSSRATSTSSPATARVRRRPPTASTSSSTASTPTAPTTARSATTACSRTTASTAPTARAS